VTPPPDLRGRPAAPPSRLVARLSRGPWLALIVAVAAHGWALGGGFVLDDRPAVLAHPLVNGRAPLGQLLEFNHHGERLDGRFSGPTLRPLATLWFAAQYRLFGQRPLPYHLIALLLYLLTLIVAHRLFVQVGVPPPQAALALALFALLAIHVEVTASIANSSGTLSLLLSLLSLQLALSGRVVGIAAGLVALSAALMVKESAAITPLLYGWLAWARGDLAPASGLRRRALSALAVLLVFTAAYLLWRSGRVPVDVQGITVNADNPLIGAPWTVRLWMPLVLLGRYLSLTLLPLGLSADYSYAAFAAQVDLSDVHGWLGLGVVIAGIWVLISALRRRAAGPLGLSAIAVGAFVLTYALPSNSLVLITITFAERLFLAPSLWLCLFAVLVFERLGELTPRLRGLALPALCLFVALQVGLAATRCLDWRDEPTLYAAQIESQPDSVKGQLFIAQRVASSDPPASLWHLGLAVVGRRAYPGQWHAPRPTRFPPRSRPRLRLLRLARLPGLLAPGAPSALVWRQLAARARRMLGSAPARVALELARRARRR
jgi:hypothetical protein